VISSVVSWFDLVAVEGSILLLLIGLRGSAFTLRNTVHHTVAGRGAIGLVARCPFSCDPQIDDFSHGPQTFKIRAGPCIAANCADKVTGRPGAIGPGNPGEFIRLWRKVGRSDPLKA
jgi:hypothetical protein